MVCYFEHGKRLWVPYKTGVSYLADKLPCTLWRQLFRLLGLVSQRLKNTQTFTLFMNCWQGIGCCNSWSTVDVVCFKTVDTHRMKNSLFVLGATVEV